eukprot:CAMPEP_0118891112 /NCGR_PEP_ID=MMETSP1166-20130328/1267_1 /TAXON_ID=1104430 /ORGANISM="Chrysoreinhardia sp, Strain CCMP3193" /LENGTH=330 /DNA_ID=CAMNT_0006829755 /DNA_START=925 /DNA_END=1914 /DNA_ORIENTATION=-
MTAQTEKEKTVARETTKTLGNLGKFDGEGSEIEKYQKYQVFRRQVSAGVPDLSDGRRGLLNPDDLTPFQEQLVLQVVDILVTGMAATYVSDLTTGKEVLKALDHQYGQARIADLQQRQADLSYDDKGPVGLKGEFTTILRIMQARGTTFEPGYARASFMRALQPDRAPAAIAPFYAACAHDKTKKWEEIADDLIDYCKALGLDDPTTGTTKANAFQTQGDRHDPKRRVTLDGGPHCKICNGTNHTTEMCGLLKYLPKNYRPGQTTWTIKVCRHVVEKADEAQAEREKRAAARRVVAAGKTANASAVRAIPNADDNTPTLEPDDDDDDDDD